MGYSIYDEEMYLLRASQLMEKLYLLAYPL